MSSYEVRLVAREEVASGTMAFHFERPAWFSFEPGQSVDLVLAPRSGAADDQDARHAFSLVSAPFERELVIATRMRDSAFKRALRATPIGATLSIDGPFGSLGLHRDGARAAVLLAGGIGITPFMSILRQAARDARSQRMVLLYANRSPEDAAFLDELHELARRNPQLRLVATMESVAASGRRWDGPRGRITGELIARSIDGLHAPVFYVVGPPGMVRAVATLLAGAGVHRDDVRSEEFHGY